MIRRSVYSVISVSLLILALAATAYIVYCGIVFLAIGNAQIRISYGCALGVAVLLFFLLPPDLLAHELGHVVFGACAGMRFPAVRIGRFVISRKGVRYTLNVQTAGETSVLPRRATRMRARLFVTAAGGALFQLFYAVAVVVLLCTVGGAPAVYFFLLYLPLTLYGAVMALLPAEPDGGKTDGAVLSGILRKDAETDVTLRVLTAQGILFCGTYADVPEPLLFDAPVVREDSRAFSALLFLQYRYAQAHGDAVRAQKALDRLASVAEHLSEDERAFVENEKDQPQGAGS